MGSTCECRLASHRRVLCWNNTADRRRRQTKQRVWEGRGHVVAPRGEGGRRARSTLSIRAISRVIPSPPPHRSIHPEKTPAKRCCWKDPCGGARGRVDGGKQISLYLFLLPSFPGKSDFVARPGFYYIVPATAARAELRRVEEKERECQHHRPPPLLPTLLETKAVYVGTVV